MLHLLTLLLGAALASASAPDCEAARAKCAYRTGCARALHAYVVDCADVLAGRTSRCPWACQRALVALTSSEVGLALSNCVCASDNEFCRRSKDRVEVCRPEVARATAKDTVVSCSMAQWICEADPLCRTALDYYHRLCKSLFHGRKCTPRCNNSLAILDRQDKAFKLRSCYCDGQEDFPCLVIKENTQRLCYGDMGVLDFGPPTTTPKPGSGSEAGAPACGLMLMLLLVLSWLRTSEFGNAATSVPCNCSSCVKKSELCQKEVSRTFNASRLCGEQSRLRDPTADYRTEDTPGITPSQYR